MQCTLYSTLCQARGVGPLHHNNTPERTHLANDVQVLQPRGETPRVAGRWNTCKQYLGGMSLGARGWAALGHVVGQASILRPDGHSCTVLDQVAHA